MSRLMDKLIPPPVAIAILPLSNGAAQELDGNEGGTPTAGYWDLYGGSLKREPR